MRVFRRLYLFISFLLATNLLGFAEDTSYFDIGLLLLVLLTPFWSFSYKKKNLYFLIILFLFAGMTAIRSYINYSQDIISSIAPLRIWFIGYIAVIVASSWPKISRPYFLSDEQMILLLGVSLLLFHVVIYTLDLSEYLIGIETRYRDGTVRFLVSPWLVLYLTFYFYHSENVVIKLLAFIFIGVILIISQTRSIIVALTAAILVGEINRISVWTIRISRKSLFLVLIAPLLLFSFLPKLSVLFGIGTEIADGENGLVRLSALNYYTSKMDLYDWVFGRGIINKKVSKNYLHEGYELADIGGFEIIHNHGIIALLLLIVLYVYWFKRFARREKLRAFGWFLLCQLFMLIFVSPIYSLEAILLNGYLLSKRSDD